MEYFDKTPNERELSLVKHLPISSAEIVKDCILPDTYGDVKKILATTAKLVPHAVVCEDDRLSYSGSLAVSILFLTDEGEVASMVIEDEYEESISLEGGSYRAVSFASLENLQSRLVNPRKIGIRAKIKPNLSLWETADTALTFPDSVTDEDRMTFEEKTVRMVYTEPECYTVSGVESGDDLMLDPPELPIGRILLSDVRFSLVTAEARDNAAAINANADITLWYLSKEEEETLSLYRYSLPVSTIVNAPGMQESDTVMAEIIWEDGSFTPRETAGNECRICECDLTYGVTVLALREKVGFLTKDCYSTRYESEALHAEVSMAEALQKHTVNTRISFNEPLKEGCLPIGAEAMIKQYHLEEGDDKAAALCGSVTAYTVLKEADGIGFSSLTKEMPFRITLPLGYSERSFITEVSVSGIEAKASADTFLTAMTVSATVLSYREKTESCVVGAKPSALFSRDPSASFTVYYPKSDETPWEIAKKYRVREEDLIFAESEITQGQTPVRVVMIMMKKEPLYRGVLTV